LYKEAQRIGLAPEQWDKWGHSGFKIEIADPIEAIMKGVKPESL